MTTSHMNASELFGAWGEDTTTSIPDFVVRARTAWARYKEYRQGVAELSVCSDRVLRDLGIYRGDIRRLSREAVYGK